MSINRLLYSADTRHNGTCLTVDKSKIYHSRGFSNGIFTLYPGHLDKFCMNDSRSEPIEYVNTVVSSIPDVKN